MPFELSDPGVLTAPLAFLLYFIKTHNHHITTTNNNRRIQPIISTMSFSIGANTTSSRLFGLLGSKISVEWFQRTLPLKLLVDGDVTLDREAARSFVHTELYKAFNDAIRASTAEPAAGCLYVYYGEPHTGKSTAAIASILRAKRHTQEDKNVFDYPSFYVDLDTSGGDWERAIREKLGIPTDLTNNKWMQLLFYNLAGEKLEDDSKWEVPGTGWINSLCGHATNADEDEGAPVPYKNEVGIIMPVIVLDQMGDLSEGNTHVLKRIYKLAAANRVLVFAVTDNERTANIIAGMNGGKRAKPLGGRYTGLDGGEKYNIAKRGADELTPFPHSIALNITWEAEPWTRETQHELILKLYPKKDRAENLGDDGYFRFLVPGEDPRVAKERARGFFGNAVPANNYAD